MKDRARTALGIKLNNAFLKLNNAFLTKLMSLQRTFGRQVIVLKYISDDNYVVCDEMRVAGRTETS